MKVGKQRAIMKLWRKWIDSPHAIELLEELQTEFEKQSNANTTS